MFCPPTPFLLAVQAISERARQEHPWSTPTDKEFGRNVFSSSSLQFSLANYQELMAPYDFLNYTKFAEFTDRVPQQDRAHLQTLIDEGKLIARTTLQSAADAVDTSSRALATAVITCRESWLYVSGFPREFQKTIENVPFDESHLHTLKDSRDTLCSPGVYMPAPRRNFTAYR